MAELIIIYWRDIPSQVIAKKGRKSAKVLMPPRFQQAIDRAAMRAGKGTSDAYLEDWKRERRDCSDDLDTEAGTAARALESDFPEAYLEAVVKAKGLAQDVPRVGH